MLASSIHRTAICAALATAALVPAAAHAQLGEEVPFITTPDHVTLEMLRIADVSAQDHVIDLGSGDGRIVITAARQFGATGLGVEIVPDLVEKSRAHARQAGVADKTEFRAQDIFDTDLSPATVITMYLLPEVNLQLRPRLLRMAPGTRIVSHDWDMGDWRPDRSTQVAVPDKKVGLEKVSRIHLWRVPAPVDGLWCAAGGWRLQVSQQYQHYRARLDGPANLATEPLSWNGRIAGTELPSPVGGPRVPALAWAGSARAEALEVRTGSPSLPAGTRFARAVQGRCAG